VAESVDSVETVFARHLKNVMAHDLEGIMADYSDDAVFFTPQGPVQGTAALRAFFSDVVLPLLDDNFVKNMKVLRQDIVGDSVYLLWEVPGVSSLGVDTFSIKGGKIVAQSFAMAAP
jgi:ketosteroid isomerase-like protein